MEPSTSGSFRLFRAAGIDVYLHWSWFVVAVLQISMRAEFYAKPTWKVVEYLSLFALVLLHEFGHALACRSVGGRADRIVLWPLGGIAYVAPPPRPGPVLWSIVAGPLVNVLLMPILVGMSIWIGAFFTPLKDQTDVQKYLTMITLMNTVLLVLNLFPVYPLDGGQIVQALLWYVVGRWRSLLWVSVVGFLVGVAIFFGSLMLALVAGVGALFLGLVAAFVAMRSVMAFQAAQYMLRLEELPRHPGIACPNCKEEPPAGNFWVCEHCQSRFDTFTGRGQCPACGAWYLQTACPFCRATNHIDVWLHPSRARQAEQPAQEEQ